MTASSNSQKIIMAQFIFPKELASEGIGSRIIWTKFKEIYVLNGALVLEEDITSISPLTSLDTRACRSILSLQ
jgi:hypothetical protein